MMAVRFLSPLVTGFPCSRHRARGKIEIAVIRCRTAGLSFVVALQDRLYPCIMAVGTKIVNWLYALPER